VKKKRKRKERFHRAEKENPIIKGLFLGLIIFLGLGFLFFLYNCIILVLYPYPIEDGEGLVMNMTKLMYSEGGVGGVYKNINSPPYIANNYPPFYPFLNLLFIPFTSLSYFSGRLISLISIIVTGILIFLMVKRETENIYAAALSSLLFFHIDYIYSFTPFYRVDMTGVGLTFLGFYLFCRNPQAKRFILPVIFFLLAIYTKHSNLAAPLAVMSYLFLTDKRKAKDTIFLFLLFGGVPFFILLLATRGQIWHHLVTYNANIYNWQRFLLHLDAFVKMNWIFLPFLFVFVLNIVWKKEWKGLVFLYFITSFFPLVASGKEGSSYHYLFETTAVFALTGGIGLGLLVNYAKTKLPFLKTSLYTIMFLIISIYIFSSYQRIFRVSQIPEAQKKVDEAIIALIARTKGRILSEEMGNGYLLLAGKEIYFYPFIMSQLAREGKWDQNKIVNEIKNRSFSRILLNSDAYNPNWWTSQRFTPEMLSAIKDNYFLEGNIANTYVYSPKL